MSGRSASSRTGSVSDSDSEIMSIGPNSLDSINSLRRSKPRHVIYEGSEVDDGDTHSELDLSLYDTDEVLDTRSSYRISLGSVASVLSDGSAPHDREGEFPSYRTRHNFDSFVSVDTATSEFNEPIHSDHNHHRALHLHQLQQQNQQLEALQRQQQDQIHEQQQRFPHAYEAASTSSFYQHVRGSRAVSGIYTDADNEDDDGDVDALRYHYGRPSRAPTGSEAFIRTTFAQQEPPLGTPTDPYDILGTPPGDPPRARPSRPSSEPNRNSAPFDEIHSQALQHLPRSMNSFLLLFLLIVGFAIGFLVLSLDPPEVYGYWLNEMGNLYIRLVNCMTVPMGICQVVFSVSTLTARGAIFRLWLKTLGFYVAVSLVSISMAIVVADGFRSSLKQQSSLNFAVSSSSTFGFQCSNNNYLELTGSTLSCSGDSFNTTNKSVFPSFVDVNDVLGLPDAVESLSFTQYLFALGARYVPNNIVQALSADMYVSSMVIATVLGVAVTRSFRGGGVGRECGDARRNPLLRLFVHLYATLFAILDWLQSLVLVAILPLTIGSVLADPANSKLLSFAGNWTAAVVVVCALQSLVVCPLLFFFVTRRQPFGWLLKVMPALLYSVLLQSPMLPLAIATKSVLRTREVPPAVFGALFPVLSACNRLAQGVTLPLTLLWAVGYSDCALPLSAGKSALLLGYALVGSLGDTGLPQSQSVFLLAVWKGVCSGSEMPQSMLTQTGVLLLISRLQSLANTIMNLFLVRMAASTDEGRMYAQNFAL